MISQWNTLDYFAIGKQSNTRIYGNMNKTIGLTVFSKSSYPSHKK